MSKTITAGWSNFIAGLLVGVLLASGGFAWLRQYHPDGSNSTTTILKLGHGLPTDHPVHDAMQFMADRVKQLSGDQLEISIYPAGMIGSEAECLKQVQNGQLDMSKTSTAVLESSVPEMAALSAPYVFRDADHFWKTLNGHVGRELAEKPKGMRGIAYFDSGERSFYTTKKTIYKPDDLKGLKIRTQQSRSAMDMVSDLGGAPTPIPWGELYTALSQGTVDGAENNLPSFDTGRHMEVCKYFSETGHVRVPDMLVISNATWEKLTPQQRAWLEEAAAEATEYQKKLWAEAEELSRRKAEDAGVQFITVNRDDFAAKLIPTWENYEPEVKKYIHEIEEVK